MNKAERFWDGIADEYDRGEGEYQETYRKTFDNTLRHLHPTDVVLDYAFGTGIISHEVAGHVKEIQGIDISSKMIEVANWRAGEVKIENVSHAQATTFNERLDRESLDAILAFSILHLLEAPHGVMRRTQALLKPGGCSSLPLPVWARTLLSILMSLASKSGNVPHLASLRLSDLEDLIANEDSQIIEGEDLDQNPPNYFIVASKTGRS